MKEYHLTNAQKIAHEMFCARRTPNMEDGEITDLIKECFKDAYMFLDISKSYQRVYE